MKSIRTWTLLLLLLVGGVFFSQHIGGGDQNSSIVPVDFSVLVKARERVANHQDPYRVSKAASDQKQESEYKYAPAAILPVFLLPASPDRAWIVCKAFYLLLWIAFVFLGAQVATWPDLGRLALGILFSVQALNQILTYGQADFLVLSGAIAAFLLLRRNQNTWAGFILGLLPAIKLPWLFLLLPAGAVVRGRRSCLKFCAGAVASILLWSILVPIIFWGPARALELNFSWLYVLRIQDEALFTMGTNQSIWSLFRRLLSRHDLSITWAFAYTFVLLATSWKLTRASSKNPLGWASQWTTLMQILNPVGWHWGALFTVGLPLEASSAKDKRFISRKGLRFLIWGLAVLLFLAQQKAVISWLGYYDWDQMQNINIPSFQWLLLLGLSL